MWGGTLYAAYSDIQFGQDSIAIDSAATINWMNGNIDADPQFIPGDTLCHLSPASPCRDAGITSNDFGGMICNCPSEDFEGEARPMGLSPDMGADEFFVVGIEPRPIAGIPKSSVLFQNYPNPFNPITAISFQLSANSFVTLAVYDVTGRKIATLVSKNLPAGKYKYHWDASGLASGVYFYRLDSGPYHQIKKLVLMK